MGNVLKYNLIALFYNIANILRAWFSLLWNPLLSERKETLVNYSIHRFRSVNSVVYLGEILTPLSTDWSARLR